MKISTAILILFACIYFNGISSKSFSSYYGNSINDFKGYHPKPWASLWGNPVSENFKHAKREITKGIQEFQEALDKVKFECISELKMDPKVMGKSLIHEQHSTTKEKCLMFCILKKTKLMENNKLSIKTIARIASMISQENPLVVSIVVANANNCNTMTGANEPCEMAFHINKCINNELKAHKLNFHY